jgi:hypothetical protein
MMLPPQELWFGIALVAWCLADSLACVWELRKL